MLNSLNALSPITIITNTLTPSVGEEHAIKIGKGEFYRTLSLLSMNVCAICIASKADSTGLLLFVSLLVMSISFTISDKLRAMEIQAGHGNIRQDIKDIGLTFFNFLPAACMLVFPFELLMDISQFRQLPTLVSVVGQSTSTFLVCSLMVSDCITRMKRWEKALSDKKC